VVLLDPDVVVYPVKNEPGNDSEMVEGEEETVALNDLKDLGSMVETKQIGDTWICVPAP